MSAKTTEQKELDQQTAKFIATLACNLPALTGEEMQGWISSPKKLKKFLADLKPLSESEKVVLDIWKTIKLGTDLKTVDDFRRQINNHGCRIGDWANDILDKPAFTVSDEEVEVDLVIKSVAELGFPNGATRAQIYDKAISLGLELCTAEVGPQLRLQHLDQPKGELHRIAMDPIADSDDDLGVFNIGHDVDDCWLGASDGSPVYCWDADVCWIFVRPRK